MTGVLGALQLEAEKERRQEEAELWKERQRESAQAADALRAAERQQADSEMQARRAMRRAPAETSASHRWYAK